jgi:S1-C subfamily serine protease
MEYLNRKTKLTDLAWYTAIVAIGVVLALIGYCTNAHAFDKEVDQSKFVLSGDPSQTYVKVKALGTALAPYVDYKEGEGIIWHEKIAYWEQGGSGVVIASDFVLTAAHVVTLDTIDVPDSTVSCFRTKPRKVLSTLILCYDYKGDPAIANIYYINQDRDIAILQINKDSFFEPLKINIPNMFKAEMINPRIAETLDSGDIVVVPVHERDALGGMTSNIKLSWGMVISPHPVTLNPENLPQLQIYDFTIDVPIIPGDSGSPVIAFLDGKPYLIGIARAMNTEGHGTIMSYATWVQNLDRYIKVQ